MAAVPDDPFFTVQEVARLLKCTAGTVLKMIYDGELEAFRVRRNWRISRESFQKVVDKQSEPPPPTLPEGQHGETLC